jgi:hypothetical protein
MQGLIETVRSVLGARNRVRRVSRTLWLTTGFVVAPEEFGPKLMRRIAARKERIRRVLAFIAGSLPGEANLMHRLGASPIAAVARLGAAMFPPAEWPTGWHSRDDDAAMSDVVRAMFDRLGQDPSPEATAALTSLGDDQALRPWRDRIAHASAIQARNRRDAEFRYPTIAEIIDTLRGGPPANVSDLRALVVSFLRELGDDLRHGSTDGYKALWNVDSYGRPQQPQPEENCRDRLLERLRARLEPLGVVAEAEGHYADDKRADIKLLTGSFNLPVEVKRHYHADLWNAPRDQLEKRYSRDPASHGYGIYLVVWFGLDHGAVPKSPPGVARPASATDLEHALSRVLRDDDRSLIEVVVLDCAAPGR